MKIIIMGCDQVGEQVSLFMDREGHAVTVIDEDAKTLEHIDRGFNGHKAGWPPSPCLRRHQPL